MSEATETSAVASPTLDDLFRRSVARTPLATALIDPADRMRITGQPPQRLSFSDADRMVSALAAHFAESGLTAGSVLAVQLPNVAEFSLTVLAAARAGLVLALVPQLWRPAELTPMLNRIGARGLVTMAKIDGVDHAQLAMNAAAETFSIRYVGSFGPNVPDDVVPLDAVLSGDSAPPALQLDGRKIAILSFDVGADGARPVPRSHAQLIAAGLAVSLETTIPQTASLMATIAPCSFVGLTLSTVLWLVTGGTLVLHHAFDADTLLAQLRDERCRVLLAPAGYALRLDPDTLEAIGSALTSVVAAWRLPEQVSSSVDWLHRQVTLTDLYAFGETGLIVAQRDPTGVATPLMPGPINVPHRARDARQFGELLLTPRGTLALRGPLAAQALDADALRDQASGEAIDTGYAARLDRTSGRLFITAPPAGLVTVGGYRFRGQDLQDWAQRLGSDAMLTALPDRISGHRLAGRASDNTAARMALNELGLNPLMAEAFRDRAP